MRPPVANAAPVRLDTLLAREFNVDADCVPWAFRWLPRSVLDQVSFVVDGAPVPKERPRVVRNTRTGKSHALTPRRTRMYAQRVRWIALQSIARSPWKREGIYAVRVCIRMGIATNPGTQGRGDIDNVLKAIMDALNGALWEDDRMVIEAHVYRASMPASSWKAEGEGIGLRALGALAPYVVVDVARMALP